jgi:ketosteroid isomerase-like protein
MDASLSAEKIRELAKALDDAIERVNIEEIVAYFADDCQIHLPSISLSGHEGLRRAISWMYRYLKEIVLVPNAIIIQGNIFFEEFTVKAKTNGRSIELKQAEVLEYGTDYKVKSIRLYFDRLQLARAVSSNFIDQIIIKRITRAFLKGLLE